MPITGVKYSKKVKLPSGYNTLALYDKNHHIIEYRVCTEQPSGKFTCLNKATKPKERAKVEKKIGLNTKTNKPIKKK